MAVRRLNQERAEVMSQVGIRRPDFMSNPSEYEVFYQLGIYKRVLISTLI
jgi:hypothetical protein